MLVGDTVLKFRQLLGCVLALGCVWASPLTALNGVPSQGYEGMKTPAQGPGLCEVPWVLQQGWLLLPFSVPSTPSHYCYSYWN